MGPSLELGMVGSSSHPGKWLRFAKPSQVPGLIAVEIPVPNVLLIRSSFPYGVYVDHKDPGVRWFKTQNPQHLH